MPWLPVLVRRRHVDFLLSTGDPDKAQALFRTS
jgi:hypothetical protein